ncbi:MAG: TolC family protein [Pirellulaceae bacterium]
MINEKTAAKPWSVPVNYSLTPSPESRLAPLDCLVSPRLPCPTPSLYAYRLPELRAKLLGDTSEQAGEEVESDEQDAAEPKGVPLPPDAWQTLPTQCLQRMLEFDSVRQEAEYTRQNFEQFQLAENDTDDAPKMTLEDVIDLALLNSREYQTQKEILFLVSLNLSEERFAYANKFSNFGNGSALDFTHNRSGGITQNGLAIPTAVRGDKLLVTGGDLLASFANNVLLTFNGPSGFAADVNSSVLINFAQPLLQRDIRFEGLTQAERDLVYAARDFARFRKQFFTDFASSYYRLILSFRQIEIASQNYFSLVRAFNQAEAEFRGEFGPRVQVDQVEQSLLNGRGSLIGTCNDVEQALDRLKLSMGIPTETRVNLDLTELNELTRLDQLSVSSDSTNRVLRRLKNSMLRPDRGVLVSTAAVLIERLLETASLTSDSNQQLSELDSLRVNFLVDEARIASQEVLADLREEVESETPSVPIIFQRSIAHARYLLELITRQLELAALTHEPSELEEFAQQQFELAQAVEELTVKFQAMFASGTDELQLANLPALVNESNTLREKLQKLVNTIDEANQTQVFEDPKRDLQRILSAVESLTNVVETTINTPDFGLKPIEIDLDDAMVTALVLRFDLMTQRESAVDDWRRIKLAADELKSVLDLNARQVIRTKSGSNQPFNFTLDDSATQLGVTFDAPLNRFTQRNDFRGSLINYQRALRNLMQLEDNIKFSVRNDLRNLALDREQYLIAVASAALAYERVVSTSLEFRLGTGGVSARDFLEAQTAYIGALSNVASRHINYILDRTQLFLDLELLTVGEDGFWQDLRNEDIQPTSVYGLPSWAFPVYGELPGVMYSHEMRRLMSIQPVCPSVPWEPGSSASSGESTPYSAEQSESNEVQADDVDAQSDRARPAESEGLPEEVPPRLQDNPLLLSPPLTDNQSPTSTFPQPLIQSALPLAPF